MLRRLLKSIRNKPKVAENVRLEIHGQMIDVELKRVKNVYFTVYDSQKVRVSAPLRMPLNVIRDAILEKWHWIRKQQNKFLSLPEKIDHKMVTGEIHFYLGRDYLLHILEHNHPPDIEMVPRNTLRMRIRPEMDAEKRKRLLQKWYREQLKELIPQMLEKWQPIIGVRILDWGIKLMKTKWGTCNITARRIWLNLELARHPMECLEYVLVHELVHLHERRHNARFHRYMDRFLPDWRERQKELDRRTIKK